MNKPTFMIVGAAKAGTTSLYHYLSQHPEISFSAEKEPHYFACEQKFSFPIIDDEEDYYNLFANATTKEIGEASTGYFYFSGTAKKIKTALPNTKIIIMLRSPLAMAFSMWGHQIREGLESSTFEQAYDSELELGKRSINGVEYGFNYIQQGRIKKQVAEYLEVFGVNNIFIGDFRELKSSPEILVKRIYSFLEVDEEFKTDTNSRFNPSGTPKYGFLHNLLNNNSKWRRSLVRPLGLFFSPEKRHSMWVALRDKNISQGSRNSMSKVAREKFTKMLKQEELAMEAYLNLQSLPKTEK